MRKRATAGRPDGRWPAHRTRRPGCGAARGPKAAARCAPGERRPAPSRSAALRQHGATATAPGGEAGDQLQGIKKGVLELADAIAVNKADGPHERDA
ncbi:hypothetical protein ACWD6Z_32865, partial [Streptomyces californicus]